MELVRVEHKRMCPAVLGHALQMSPVQQLQLLTVSRHILPSALMQPPAPLCPPPVSLLLLLLLLLLLPFASALPLPPPASPCPFATVALTFPYSQINASHDKSNSHGLEDGKVCNTTLQCSIISNCLSNHRLSGGKTVALL